MLIVGVEKVRALCGKKMKAARLVRCKALEIVGTHLVDRDYDDKLRRLGLAGRLGVRRSRPGALCRGGDGERASSGKKRAKQIGNGGNFAKHRRVLRNGNGFWPKAARMSSHGEREPLYRAEGAVFIRSA